MPFLTTIRSRDDRRIAALVLLTGLVIGIFLYAKLWVPALGAVSVLSGRLPYWDYSNLWAGSRMAFEGNVATLFDAEHYRTVLREIFQRPELPNQEWSYPPSILLIGVPLSFLPIFWSYWLWTIGTIACLHFAIRPARLPLLAHLAVLTSPTVAISAFFGQNGSLTAALLIGGLFLSQSRPVLAGVLLGILTIKPHLGLLIPVCLLASLNIRCIISATATSLLMVLVTGLFFGFDVWPLFFAETGKLMASIMEAPYPQHYHANAVTAFVLGRSLGLGVSWAYGLQAFFLLASAVACFYLWRPSNGIDLTLKVSVTALSTILATPYGYTYDMVPFAFALAVWLNKIPSFRREFFAILWLFPFFVHQLNFEGVGIGVLAPAAFALYCMVYLIRDVRARQAIPAIHP